MLSLRNIVRVKSGKTTSRKLVDKSKDFFGRIKLARYLVSTLLVVLQCPTNLSQLQELLVSVFYCSDDRQVSSQCLIQCLSGYDHGGLYLYQESEHLKNGHKHLQPLHAGELL